MGITALNLPIDIPWERVCVSTEMLDPDIGAGPSPPLWQTSIALFRYVPADEFQIYGGRRIIYYKLTCTITGYTPQASEILGNVDPGHLGIREVPGITEILNVFLPCNGAIVQATVVPTEKDRKIEAYPYFMEMQPRQRLLYEQATDTKESTSRNLEGLQVRKDAATSNSLEVMDVDGGGSAQFQVAGTGGGGSQSGQWGTKSLGKIDSGQMTTADASREARETLSFTTQLTQMYTTLQSYQLGTNRVFFFLTPRPHVLEVPSGFISGPRQIDGIQDFFLVVNQAKGDTLPCLEIRLDTSHLTIKDDLEYDRSKPTQRVTIDWSVAPPVKEDPAATATGEGSNVFYSCSLLTKTSPPIEVEAPSGYVIDEVKEVIDPLAMVFPPGTIPGTVPNPQPTADGKKVTFIATGTSYACHRNGAGDAFNHAATGIGYYINPDFPLEATSKHYGAHVRRTFDVSFRSEVKNKKIGERQILLLTTRILRCCDDAKSEPAKIIDIIEMPILNAVPYTPPSTTTGSSGPGDLTFLPVMQTATMYTPPASSSGGTPNPGIPGPAPGTGPVPTSTGTAGMSARQANEIGQMVANETRRASLSAPDPRQKPALDTQYLIDAMMGLAATDPQRAVVLARPAASLGLKGRELEVIAQVLGKPSSQLTSHDVASAPPRIIEMATMRKGPEVLKMQLEAIGLRPPPEPSAPTPGARQESSSQRSKLRRRSKRSG